MGRTRRIICEPGWKLLGKVAALREFIARITKMIIAITPNPSKSMPHGKLLNASGWELLTGDWLIRWVLAI